MKGLEREAFQVQYQSNMSKIEFLQLLKSSNSIGKLSQPSVLKIRAKPAKGRVKVSQEPLWVCLLSC